MRILLFGDEGYDMVSEQLASAFRQLGHEGERFYFKNRKSFWPDYLYKFFVRSPWYGVAIKLQYLSKNYRGQPYYEKIIQFKPDLIIIIHFNAISPDLIKKIRKTFNIPVAWWVMADNAAVSRFDPFYGDLHTYCSHLFVADASWISSIKLLGDSKISYLPFAADLSLYYPMSLDKKYDIGIVANFTSFSPTTIHKGLILKRLCQEGFKIRAVTKGIKRFFSIFPELERLDLVDDFYQPPQVNEIYNQTKIILAVNNPQAKSDPAVRVMEVAASGNFQLAEYRENTEKLMGDSVVQFRTLDELVQQVKFYLANDQERERLSRKSREMVLKNHTIMERAKEILEKIKV